MNKILLEIQNELAAQSGHKDWHTLMHFCNVQTAGEYWKQVCHTAQLECAKVTLETAAINTRHHHPGVETSCITDPENITIIL